MVSYIDVLSDTSRDLVSLYHHYVKKVPKDMRLNYEIKSDQHIHGLAEKMTGWEEKYNLFHLDKHNIHDIKNGVSRDKPTLQ